MVHMHVQVPQEISEVAVFKFIDMSCLDAAESAMAVPYGSYAVSYGTARCHVSFLN